MFGKIGASSSTAESQPINLFKQQPPQVDHSQAQSGVHKHSAKGQGKEGSDSTARPADKNKFIKKQPKKDKNAIDFAKRSEELRGAKFRILN